GKMSDYGLPEPDHEPLSAHPSVSIDFLAKSASGDLTCVPNIARLDGDAVVLTDGRRIEADAIVYATGYNMSFPFLHDPELLPDADHRRPLFCGMIRPGIDNLDCACLAQSARTIVKLARQRAKLIAAHLTGEYALPAPAQMEQTTSADARKHSGQYFDALRHTIHLDLARYNR